MLLEDTKKKCNWSAYTTTASLCPIPLQIYSYLLVDTALNILYFFSFGEREGEEKKILLPSSSTLVMH